MKKYLFAAGIAFLFFFVSPTFARADVLINEVAWMGTADSQYGEWVELYNTGSGSVSLSGWKLYKGDGSTLVFTLSKTISAGGYLIIERTTASSPDPLPNINDESGPFGGSGLLNSGENLVLKDANGATSDALDFSSGWPAGDNTTKETMQKSGSSWITAPATPDTATTGTIPDSGTGGTNTTTDNGSTADTTPDQTPKKAPVYKISAQIITNTTAVSGIPSTFSHITLGADHQPVFSGVWVWNFGDGTTRQDTVAPQIFTHTFPYPGDYSVTLEFKSLMSLSAPDATDRMVVSVIVPQVVISNISYDGAGGIELSNASGIDMDISGWVIRSGGNIFMFPRNTTILQGKKLMLSSAVLGLNVTQGQTMALLYPDNTLASIFPTAPKEIIGNAGAERKIVSVAPILIPPVMLASASSPMNEAVSTETAVAALADAEISASSSKNNVWIFGGFAGLVIAGIGTALYIRRKKAKAEKSLADEFTIVE